MMFINTKILITVVVAATAAWLFGALWYGLLGRYWVAAQGKTFDEFEAMRTARNSRAADIAPFVLSFVAAMLMAWVLYGILAHLKIPFTVRSGLISAAFCWTGFVLTTIAVNNAYTFRRPMLTLIDAGHWLGAMLIIGGIVGWLGAP